MSGPRSSDLERLGAELAGAMATMTTENRAELCELIVEQTVAAIVATEPRYIEVDRGRFLRLEAHRTVASMVGPW